MKRDPLAYTATRVVNRLFIREATRLQLMRSAPGAVEVNLGGWCKSAVRDIVRHELDRHQARALKPRKAKR